MQKLKAFERNVCRPVAMGTNVTTKLQYKDDGLQTQFINVVQCTMVKFFYH